VSSTGKMQSPSGCSICGTAGQLRRGWCEMHYQRWYRNGSTERKRHGPGEGAFRCKVKFSERMWNKWLTEFNTLPGNSGVESINSLRHMIEERELLRARNGLAL
jgi:hypothetical protein